MRSLSSTGLDFTHAWIEPGGLGFTGAAILSRGGFHGQARKGNRSRSLPTRPAADPMERKIWRRPEASTQGRAEAGAPEAAHGGREGRAPLAVLRAERRRAHARAAALAPGDRALHRVLRGLPRVESPAPRAG